METKGHLSYFNDNIAYELIFTVPEREQVYFTTRVEIKGFMLETMKVLIDTRKRVVTVGVI